MLTRKRQKEIASLRRKKGREALQQTLVEGWRALDAALLGNAPLVEVVCTHEAVGSPAFKSLEPRLSCPIFTLTSIEFKRLSDVETSQGILGVTQIPEVEPSTFADCKKLVLLDGVQDPGNVGTIIRTAAWFGIEGIIASPDSADPFHPKVVRASMGGVWDVPVARMPLLDQVPVLESKGFKLIGADLQGTPLIEWHPPERCAIVLGGEANGITPEMRTKLNQSLSINGVSLGGTESLNVAVASGIILYRWSCLIRN